MLSKDLPARTPCIVGVGTTAFGALYRDIDPERQDYDLALDAFWVAMEDSGLSKSEIDSVICGRLASYLKFCAISGLKDIRYSNLQPGGGSQSGVAVMQAASMIMSGHADVVACVYGNSGRSSAMNYGGISIPTSRYDDPYGMTSNGGYYGMAYQRHAHEFGTTTDALAAIAMSNRANALNNPNAVMRTPMTIEDYYASPMIADPLRRLDYCMVNDGGVAYLVTTLERARDLKKAPVRILSSATAGVMQYFYGAEDCWFGALDDIRQRLFGPVGMSPADVDVFQTYDNFTPAALFATEGIGICERGEGNDWFLAGHHKMDGAKPMNTAGGHLSESYMQGWALTVESVRQLRGEAGPRQVAGAQVALDVTCSPICSAYLMSL